MSLVSWTLAKNGAGEKSLADWGISSATLALRSLDVDELTIRNPVADVTLDPIFAYGDKLTLRRIDAGVATIWFIGSIRKLPGDGSSEGENNLFVACGAWWDLLDLIYQQTRAIAKPAFDGFDPADTTHVMLCQDVFGNPQTTGAQIRDVFTNAAVQGSLNVVGSVPDFINAPYQEARNISCAEAVRRMMAFSPDAVGYFDYSSGIPTFFAKPRSALTQVTLDLTAAALIKKWKLTPRADLVPAGVVFTFVGSALNVTDGKQYSTLTVQSAGATTGIGVLRATIDLMGVGTPLQEIPPAGLAAAYYTSLITTNYEGTFLLKESDCSGIVKIGNSLNLSSGRAAWLTMQTLVQAVTYDLVTGETELECGLPDHLGAQTFVNQLLFNKPAFSAVPAAGTTFNQTKTTGVDPSSNSAAGHGAQAANGANTIAIDVCDTDTGRPVTKQVVSPCNGAANPCS